MQTLFVKNSVLSVLNYIYAIFSDFLFIYLFISKPKQIQAVNSIRFKGYIRIDEISVVKRCEEMQNRNASMRVGTLKISLLIYPHSPNRALITSPTTINDV